MKNGSVFFLGAGFSKALNPEYPDLHSLSKEIKNLYENNQNTIAQHYNHDIPDEYKSNIEFLLTYLSNKLPFKTDVETSLDTALYKDIIRQISEKFYKIKEDIHSSYNKSNSITHYMWEHSCPCITLNYDLLLETLIIKSLTLSDKAIKADGFAQFYHYPILNPYKQVDSQYIKLKVLSLRQSPIVPPSSMPNILKLHGSINWYINNYDESGLVQYEQDYKNTLLSPFIIPPILDKTQLYKNLTLEKCWNTAFQEIKEAKRIFIYGFSFPKTDIAIRFLFQSALKLNLNKPTIYIINTKSMVTPRNKNYAQNRYKDIFKGYDLNFEYCCDNSLEKFNKEISRFK